MTEDFSKYNIKEYRHWTLFLHKEQSPYIGRCYAWAKREEADKITGMTKEERNELFEIIFPEWDETIFRLFDYNRPNLAIFGNITPHLHAHLIPRYDNPRKFKGIIFEDKNPNGNYAPYEKRKLPKKILMQIKKNVQKTLESLSEEI